MTKNQQCGFGNTNFVKQKNAVLYVLGKQPRRGLLC